MEWAMTSEGEQIRADQAVKGIPYFCLNCGTEVFLARGEKYRPHYRHYHARNSQEVLQCEYYCSHIMDKVDSFKVNESELDARTQVRLELCQEDGEWKPFLRFPVIPPKYHRVIDREQLYFNVRCVEEEHEFSSLCLLGLIDVYKMSVQIRDTYTITVSHPMLEERFQIKISGSYKPFQSKILLFKFIQGSLLHIPYRNVMLNERFFILTKIPLNFPSELHPRRVQQLDEYELYELQMPEKIDPQLIHWFSQVLNVNLIPAECHLDLLEPVSFRMIHGLVEVSSDEVKLLLTCKGTKPKVSWIKVITPVGEPKIILLNERTLRLSLPSMGLYTVYPLNQRGGMLEIRRIQKIVHESCNSLIVSIDDQQRLFTETTFSRPRIRLTSNCPVMIYPSKGKPYRIKSSRDLELNDVRRLHVPSLWSFKQQVQLEQELSTILKIIKHRARFKEVYVGMERFHQLCQFISNTTYRQKNRLLLLLNMKRGFVPSIILSMLHGMEEST